MEKEEIRATLKYFEKNLDDLNDRFFAFLEKNEKQMDELARSISQKEGLLEEKFIKKTELTLMFKNLEFEMKQINNIISDTSKGFGEISQYKGMLSDIKEERDDLRLKIFSWVHEAVLALVAAGTGWIFWKNK